MISRHFIRNFYFSSQVWSPVNKSDLAKLRKKTGYTFANCKKALEINKDFDSAEKWLKEQAQALGWTKAAKLEGRATQQGLVGVLLKNNRAIMLEVNCETDFVGRNKKFKTLVELSTDTCMKKVSQSETHSGVMKFTIDREEIKSILANDGKNLGDHCALTIADLGENISLRRALCIKTTGDIHLAAYAHPSTPDNPSEKVTVGKYGAIVAYKTDSNDIGTQHLARQLCQHVVGMNPKKVGVLGEDEPAACKDDEESMLHQEFLLDPELTVSQFISNANIHIVDFARVECGEVLVNDEDPVKLRASG